MHQKDVVLILHNVRSRFNVGAIFRTADVAGVKKIYLCGITPAPPHPKIDKVALGAATFVPFEKRARAADVLKELSAMKYLLVTLEQSKKVSPISSGKKDSP